MDTTVDAHRPTSVPTVKKNNVSGVTATITRADAPSAGLPPTAKLVVVAMSEPGLVGVRSPNASMQARQSVTTLPIRSIRVLTEVATAKDTSVTVTTNEVVVN